MACIQKLPNGKKSELFDKLLQYFNGDETVATSYYVKAHTRSFKNTFGDWENNKLKDTYKTGEPLLEKVLNIEFSKGKDALQIETLNKIISESSKIIGPSETGPRYFEMVGKKKIGYTGVNSWLAKEGSIQFDEPTLKFDDVNYRKKEIEKALKEFEKTLIHLPTEAKNERLKNEKARIIAEVDKKIAESSKVGELGTYVHAVLEGIISSKERGSESQATVKKFLADNDIDVDTAQDFSDVYKKSLAIINDIIASYPNENVKLVAEQKLVFKKLGLVGLADLIVIREDGSVDLYDWKSSKKNRIEWGDAKQRNIFYQLGFYKNMLEAYGIKVNSVNIIPINLEPSSDNKILSGANFQIDPVERLNYTNENVIIENINSVIPTEIIAEKIQIKDNKLIKDFLLQTLNYTEEVEDVTDEDIDNFIKVRKSLGYTEFTNFYDNKKNNTYSLDDVKIKERVRSFLKQKRLISQAIVDNTYEYIEKVRKTGNYDGIKLNSIPIDSTQYQVFKKYVEDYDIRDVNGKPTNFYKWQPIITEETRALGLLVMRHRTTGVTDIIALTDSNLNERLDFPDSAGKTLAGILVSSPNKEKELKLPEATIARAIEMKIGLFLLQNESLFNENYKIGDISLFSTNQDVPRGIIAQDVIRNLKTLTNLTDNAEVKTIVNSQRGELINMTENDYLSSLKSYLVTMTSNPYLHNPHRTRVEGSNSASKIKNDFETRTKLLDAIYEAEREGNTAKTKLVKELHRRQTELLEKGVDKADSQSDDYSRKMELKLIAETLAAFDKIQVYNETDLSTYGNFATTDSKALSIPDEMTKRSVQALIKLRDYVGEQIRADFREEYEFPMRDLYIGLTKVHSKRDPLKFSKLARIFTGKSAQYANLFEFKIVGDKKINTFKLRDPNDARYNYTQFNQFPLEAEEVAFINEFKKQVSKYRQKSNSSTAQTLPDDYIPLTRISGNTRLKKTIQKLKAKGVKKTISEFLDDISNSQNALESDKTVYEEKTAKMLEVFSAYDYADSQMGREKELSESLNREEDFETDLEVVLSLFAAASIKKEKFAEVLPRMNVIRSLIAVSDMKFYTDFKNTKEYLEMIMKGTIYGKTHTSKEEEKLNKFFEPIMSFTSALSIGLSPATSAINVLTNIWQTNSSIIGFGRDRFGNSRTGLANFARAFQYVFVDIAKGNTMDGINFLDYLNEEFGINNMEVSRMVSQMRTDKVGVKQFESWLHFLNSYPEFMFRMSLFLAEAMSDGVFKPSHANISRKSALTWDKEKRKIVYDPSKDDRFSILYDANSDKQSVKYLKAKALYDGLWEDVKDLRNGHNPDKIGFDGRPELSTPYSVEDRKSKIKFANRVYQETSTENKTWIERTALGSLYMMFKRWMLSKKELYWKGYVSAEENTIAGRREVIFDEVTGTYKSVWLGRPMEGILQSLIFYGKEIARYKGNVIKANQELSDYQIRNIRHFLADMTQYGLIGLFVALAGGDDEMKKNKLLKLLYYSSQDLNVLNTWENLTTKNGALYALSYMTKFGQGLVDDALDVTINHELPLNTLKNIGLTRTGLEYIQGVYK